MLSTTRAVGLGPVLRQTAIASRAASRNLVFKRFAQTESLPPSAAIGILNKQRLNRPSSPHFTIYQPQLTWVASIFNRATGVALSVLLYGYSIAYLVAPGTFDSAHVVEFIHGLPEWTKYAGKALLALPFSFHSWNGLRHLAWDTGRLMTVKGAYSSGYTVLALTGLTSIGLVLW